ncbi:MAG: hypothetical protein ACLTAI_08145 [Thomasclavelia sp.]
MIFRAMCKIADEYDGCPFGESHIISDTETFGVWSEHETSRTKHIKDMLLVPLKRKHKGLSEEQLHLLSGVYTDGDPIMSAQKNDKIVSASCTCSFTFSARRNTGIRGWNL